MREQGKKLMVTPIAINAMKNLARNSFIYLGKSNIIITVQLHNSTESYLHTKTDRLPPPKGPNHNIFISTFASETLTSLSILLTPMVGGADLPKSGVIIMKG